MIEWKRHDPPTTGNYWIHYDDGDFISIALVIKHGKGWDGELHRFSIATTGVHIVTANLTELRGKVSWSKITPPPPDFDLQRKIDNHRKKGETS